jgi:hypothetical protein
MKMLALMMSLFALGLASASGPVLNGRYQMKLTIGERIFDDVMVLESIRGEIPLAGFRGDIQGEVIVPGVFSAPLKGEMYCQIVSCRFEFTIIAKENGKEFAVLYSGRLSNYQDFIYGSSPVFQGEARLQSGELLGSFTATREDL